MPQSVYEDRKTVKLLQRYLDPTVSPHENQPLGDVYVINQSAVKLKKYLWDFGNLEIKIPAGYSVYHDYDLNQTPLSGASVKHNGFLLPRIYFEYESMPVELRLLIVKDGGRPEDFLSRCMEYNKEDPMNQLLDSRERENSLLYTYRHISRGINIFHLLFFKNLPDKTVMGDFACPNSFSDEWEKLFEELISTIKEVKECPRL